MWKTAIFFMLLLTLGACNGKREEITHWEYLKTMNLDSVNPIGIAFKADTLWLSDGDHNRLVGLNSQFMPTVVIDSLDRPMHIASWGTDLWVPQYGNDEVVKISGKDWTALQIQDSLDAPAGVFAFEAELAIADFYNHRIMYNNGEKWTQIGSEGKGAGQFYYPTDVHIDDSHIWVADAYNNRVQKFDKSGQFVQTIASDQKINAATGLFVSTTQLFVTDFEHSRVLVFDMFGNLQGTLSNGIEKPTDILQVADTLYICNYRNASLTLYVQKPGASETK